MIRRSNIRYFIFASLLFATMIGNAYLGLGINSHIEKSKDYVKTLTEDDKYLRYSAYTEIKQIKQQYKNFTIFTFGTVLFCVFILIACEKQTKGRHDD